MLIVVAEVAIAKACAAKVTSAFKSAHIVIAVAPVFNTIDVVTPLIVKFTTLVAAKGMVIP